MQALLFIPLSHSYLSRYRYDRAFYLIVEYVPALLVCLLFGSGSVSENLTCSLLSFLAFTTIYEIGYLANDYISVRWESEPRHRTLVPASMMLLTAWVAARLLFFWAISVHLSILAGPMYWVFFTFLVVIFSAHNLLRSPELRLCTFYWLSLCRFLAPNIWTIEPCHFGSLALAGSILYSGFRLLGYLESKNLLTMKGRKGPAFRLLYYTLPLPLAFGLGASSGLGPFQILAPYYFLGALVSPWLRSKPKSINLKGSD